MKKKILKLFSSNIKIKVTGKNINNFLKKLIADKINIIKIIPLSHKEIELIINYNDINKILKYKRLYNIKIERYYGKLNIIRLIKKNTFILIFTILGITLIYTLSNIIFNIEVIHSNKSLINLITEELEIYGIKKYSLVKDYHEIEEIEKKILEKNKDKLEWLEIIRSGTKYIVRLEERIINNRNDDNKIYDIVASKNCVIKEINAESGTKVKNIDTFVKKGEVVISSNIILPNNETKVSSSKGTLLGEVWYNVNIIYPYHYHEEKYTKNKRKVLVFNIFNKKIAFFNYKKYKTFNRNTKYIFNNPLSPVSLSIEYQYETKVIDIKYTNEEAKEAAVNEVKRKLKEKYPGIKDIKKVIITSENDNVNQINLNLFISALEDITEYKEVNNEKSE